MSVYIAASSPNVNASHPIFRQRGIPQYTQAPLNTIFCQGISHYQELAYDGYRANISTFIAATNRGNKISAYQTDNSFTRKRPLPLVKEVPVGFISKAKLSPEQEASLLGKMAAYGPSTKKIGKGTTVFILGRPNRDVIPSIDKTSTEQVNPSPDYLTPKGYKAYIFVHEIISEFLATNTYPAFLAEDMTEGPAERMELAVNPGRNAFLKTKRRADDFASDTPVKKVRKTTTDDKGVESSMEVDEEGEMKDLDIFPEHTMRGMVLVAKPSPIPASANIGGPAEVPHLPGLVFPYFDRMHVPDLTTARSILSTFFLRNFGDDREAQRSKFNEIKAGLEHLSKTREGGVISHLLTGIRLALETQTRLFVVQASGEYSGFCLLGAMFSVTVNGMRYSSESAEKLRKQLEKMTSHSLALSNICEALTRMKIAGPAGNLDPRPIEAKDVKNARHLWSEIALRFAEGADATVVSENVAMLAFTRSYLDVNVENIVKAMRKVSLEDMEPWDEETPTFLPTQLFLYSDPIAKTLAVFGPLAPSFINATGSTFVLQEDPKKDPMEEADAKGNKNPPHILVSLKPLHMSVIDMKKFVREHAFVMDLAERAGKNRNVVFSGKARDALVGGLRETLFSAISKKRKAEDMSGGPSRKKVETAADVLDAW